MPTVNIFKETALPGTLQANSIYFIAPPSNPDYVEMYVTGISPTTVRRIIKESDIEAMISTALSGISQIDFVENITARDALAAKNGLQIIVVDASGDPTVASGAATYVYRESTTSWIKIAEHESQDISFTWSALQNKPSSSVGDIDDAVTKRHTHTNKTQLDKIGEDGGGNLTYNGNFPKIAWETTSW